MAYKFICSSCNSDITSNYLKPGEEAFCFKCGSRTKVPGDAKEVDFVPGLNRFEDPFKEKSMIAPIVGKFSGVKAWNPRWFEGMSVPFGFLVPGILWSLNFERFGQPERKLPAMAAVVVVFAVVMSCIGMIDAVPKYVVLAVNYGFGLYFYHSQKKQFADFLAQGASKASFGVPITIQVVAFVLLIMFLIRSREDLESARIDVIDNAIAVSQALNAGNYELVDSLTRDEDDNLVSSIRGIWLISRKLIETGRPDTALVIVETRLREEPADRKLLALRHLARSHLKKMRGDVKGAIAEVEIYLDYEPSDWRTANLKHEWKNELGDTGR